MVSQKSTILTSVLLTFLVCIVVAGVSMAYIVGKYDDDKASLETQITQLKADLAAAQSTNSGSTDKVSYTNPNFKYTMTLPAGYAVVDYYDCEGGCASSAAVAKKIKDGSYSDIFVKVEFSKFEGTLDAESTVYKNENKNDVISESSMEINGISAKKFEVGGFAGGYIYFAVNDGYLLKITQYPSDNVINQKVVDSILSTFQFAK